MSRNKRMVLIGGIAALVSLLASLGVVGAWLFALSQTLP